MKNIIAILFCTLTINTLTAQQLAFPTAEGAGKYSKGGRGTTTSLTRVFYVTNLNDDGLVGSLRYALSTGSATSRTVVFNVSGTIHLIANLQIKANTTLAGQTAPGDGICIADYPVSISGDNVIVRYMRFRLGDKNQNKGMVNGSGGDDALGGTGRKNIIVDHCTMSWSNDETCSIYSGDSTTIQWCMMSEPLNYSYHFETGDADFEHHAFGGIWGGKMATFHHNLFAHCKGRACRFDGSRNLGNGTTVGLENCEFSNNVIYNWGDYNVNGGEGGNYNILSNYYKYGPSTSNKKMIINPFKDASLTWGKYYVTGNYVDGNTSTTNNNWLGAVVAGGTAADTTTIKVTVPFALISSNIQTATTAYNTVLAGVGASLPNRDTLDQRIVNDVKNRTGKLIDCQGGYPHLTAYNLTTAAWPTLTSGTAAIDGDNDGMPNWWETRAGLNPTLATDRNGVAANGYTNLENYLDSIPAWNNHAQYVAFSGNKVSSSVAQFNFTTHWVKDGFTYSLFRSSDSLGVYTVVSSIASEMNTINFNISDASLPATTTYYKIGSYKVGFTPDTLYSKIVKIVGILPLKIMNYKAIPTPPKEGLNNWSAENIWTTANEINVSHFNIQRSNNGKKFETIGTVVANNKINNEYHFTDELKDKDQLPKTLYYRLEIIDKDGSKAYSEIKQVTINNKPQTINIYPNPATSTVNIECVDTKEILIINYLGKTIYQSTVNGHLSTINTQSFTKGIYIVKAILNNGKIKTEKLVIE